MLAMRGTEPFSSAKPAAPRWQEQSVPEASGWTTKNMQALTPLWTTHSEDDTGGDAEPFCVRFSPADTPIGSKRVRRGCQPPPSASDLRAQPRRR